MPGGDPRDASILREPVTRALRNCDEHDSSVSSRFVNNSDAINIPVPPS